MHAAPFKGDANQLALHLDHSRYDCWKSKLTNKANVYARLSINASSGRGLGDSPFGEPACISEEDPNWLWDLGTWDLGSSPQRPGNTTCLSISQELLWSWWLAVKSTSTAQLFFLPSHQLEVCGGKFVAPAPEFDSGTSSGLVLLALLVLPVDANNQSATNSRGRHTLDHSRCH